MKTSTCVAIIAAAVSWTTTAYSADSLSDLRARMKIEAYDRALQNADQSGLAGLPAKGFKGGAAGFMTTFEVYPNPRYSFTNCEPGAVIRPNGNKTGCIVSFRLAKKNPDGTFKDLGIRIEYGVAVGEKAFQENNSAYAEHLIKGDGVLPAMLQ